LKLASLCAWAIFKLKVKPEVMKFDNREWIAGGFPQLNSTEVHPEPSFWSEIRIFWVELQRELNFVGVQLDLEVLDDCCNRELHVDLRKSE
jgi:hypothetical protein